MYTQCPKCLTYFQVTADHLKVAQGNVRCGQCSNVFSALGNLSEKPPQGANSESSSAAAKNPASGSQSRPTPAAANTAGASAQSKLSNAIEAIQALNQSSQKILSQSRKNYVSQLQRHAQVNRNYPAIEGRDSTAPDLNQDDPEAQAINNLANDLAETPDRNIDFDEALAAVDEIEIDLNDEGALPQEDSPIQYGLDDDEDITPAIDGSHLVEDYAIEESLFAEEPEPKPKPEIKAKSKSAPVSDGEFNINELDLPATDEPDSKKAGKQPVNKNKTTKKKSRPGKKTRADKRKTKKPTATKPAVAKPEPVPEMVIENNIPTLAIPKQLLEDFQEEQPIHPAHYRSMITWGLGSLMLMFVFLGQAIYFKHNELGQISQFRPWVEFFCKHASCELSLQVDISQIELLGQDIRSHPKSKKALLVSATIINNAAFTQPYPGLQLNFSDMNGEKVAMRNFLPKDYLPSKSNIEKGMESNVPIQLELEIVDPGKNAVNFEFDFFSI